MRKPVVLAFLLLIAPAWAQDAPRTLRPADYGQWESLRGTSMSNDGRWIATGIARVDGDPRVELRSVDGPERAVIEGASSAEFSEDARWAAAISAPPKKVADRLREQKLPVENKLVLRDLRSGEERVLDSVQRFAFAKGARALLAHRYRGAAKKEGGSDLTVVMLDTGREATFGNIVGFSLNESETMVAVGVESDSGSKGIQVITLATMSVDTVQWGRDAVSSAAWAKDVDALSFLVGRADEKKDGPWNRVVIASNLGGIPAIATFDPKPEQLPEGFRIAEDAPINISDDGTTAYFGIRAWGDAKKPPVKPEDAVGLDVWHWKDLDINPLQKRRAGIESRRSYLSVWSAAGGFRQIADATMRSGVVLPGQKFALLTDDLKYKSSTTNGLDFSDVFLVEIATGKRTTVLEKTQWGGGASPKGRYLSFYQNGHWWVYDTRDGSRVNVTEGLGASFADLEDDHTVPERPPVDRPDWLAGDAGMLVYSHYGVYLWRAGRPRAELMLDGARDHLVYRLTDVGDGQEPPSLTEPLYFRAFDDVDKGAGFFRLEPNAGAGKMLVFEAAATMDGLKKAKDADRMFFTMGSFEKSPNVLITNGLFTQAKPMTNTNPQQKEFLWGKSELVKYKSRAGKDLQGTLIYPADYDPKRLYPMVVYIYEKLSDGKNRYIAPSEWSAYNPQVLSQEGYFVYMPDIVYVGNSPGTSAADCLEPAVAAVLRQRVGVNPDKVGLMGHSWGGYQTAYMLSTGTKTFAVGVAGAPLTELVSMYLSVYANSGTPNGEIFETSQGRMAVPFYADPETYMKNSAVWNAKGFRAPILVTFGDQDGAVDWHQGLYLYNTLRRMGKEIILLVYAGENHNFTRRPDQLDYAKRVRHYLDVYLKGITPEPWVKDGVPVLQGAGG